MALGNVFMTDTDGKLGAPVRNFSEKVCGLLFDISAHSDFWTSTKGLAVKEKLEQTVIELNSLEDAKEFGITERTGKDDLLEGIPYYHIQQFFGMAGGSGRLFVMFADCSKSWESLIDMQKASNGMISQIGVWTEQNLWTQLDPEAPTYSTTIASSIQEVAAKMADEYYSPASILLNANSSKVKTSNTENGKIVLTKIPTCVGNERYVSVLLGQSSEKSVREMQGALKSTTPVGNVGLALGALAKAGVGDSIGWVANFDLVRFTPVIEMGFGDATLESDNTIKNGTSYASLTRAQLDDLDTKGYVFMRTYEGLEGHTYFTKDQTCSNGDYCTIARNRAINKSRRLVRTALLPYVNSPVKVDPASGKISKAQATVYTNLIKDALVSMETAEEISGIGKIIVPTDQNILVTHKLTFSYSLIPFGCAESIEVTEGLDIKR